MQVVNLGLIGRMPAGDEIINHSGLQWPRAEQRNQRDEIVKTIRLHALDQITHAAGFELKDSRCLRAAQQFECLLILVRNVVDIEVRNLCRRINNPFGPIDDCQRLEAEEVKLDETNRLNIVFVELSDDLRATIFAIERRKIG